MGELRLKPTQFGYEVRHTEEGYTRQYWWVMGSATRAERVARRKIARHRARTRSRMQRTRTIEL